MALCHMIRSILITFHFNMQVLYLTLLNRFRCSQPTQIVIEIMKKKYKGNHAICHRINQL
jgi:hypothetical protein